LPLIIEGLTTILTGILAGILTAILAGILTGILAGILGGPSPQVVWMSVQRTSPDR
jgi:hypothetical protein